MFKFTPIEKKVVAAIEANYRQQMHDMMVRYFKVPYKGKIESTELEAWLNSIEVTRELCNIWLSNMVDSPTVEDHLNNGIFSVAAIGTSSILSFLFIRAVNFFPEYIKKYFHSRDAHGKRVAETVGETFSTALTPVVLRFLHDAFCRTYHGNRDEAETLFQEMVEKNEHFTKLIQQECSALSVELVKLFRFREMLLLGKKDKLALNFDVRKDFIKRAKDPKDSFKLMGFGHRVYKNYDPRAAVMREACHNVLNELGRKNNPYLAIALDLEDVALNDSYFRKKKLYPNVDFYSGILLWALGFPLSMYTAVFAVARTVGWVAHWKEMIEVPSRKISRPRQLYTGYKKREYVELDKRNEKKSILKSISSIIKTSLKRR